MEKIRETQQWSKTGKRGNNGTLHTCISVSLAILGLFKTPTEAVAGLKMVTQAVENEKIKLVDKRIKIQTIISNYETMWCPKAVHKNSDRIRMEF